MSTTPQQTPTTTAAADRKVLADLEILLERMRRCDELLAVRSSGENGTTVVVSTPMLLDVMGFLEASAPRMVELVEVAAQGIAVSEPVLMKCLDVNDKLTKILGDIDAVTLVSEVEANDSAAGITTDTEELPSIATTKSEDEFDAFLNDRVTSTSNTTNDPDSIL